MGLISWSSRSTPGRSGSTAGAASSAGLRLLLGRLADPGHHRPQLGPDLLDLMLGRAAAKRLELRPSGRLLGDDVAGEAALLDVAQEAAHRLAHVLVDDDGAAGEVAVLGRVRDRVAHAGQAALPDQVDDQLQLVQAFEIRDL